MCCIRSYVYNVYYRYILVGFSNRFSLPYKRHYILGIYTAIFGNIYRYIWEYIPLFWGIYTAFLGNIYCYFGEYIPVYFRKIYRYIFGQNAPYRWGERKHTGKIYRYILKIYRYIFKIYRYTVYFQNILVYFQNILVYFPQVLVWLLVDNTCLKTPSKNVLERHTKIYLLRFLLYLFLTAKLAIM